MKKNEDKNIISEIHEYNINEQTREIFLHSSFLNDEDNGIDFKKANQFLKNILYLGSEIDPITIHMNSIGGEYPLGMMIYDAIKHCQSSVTIVCHGEICSMGMIILQAADYRLSMPNCRFLIHLGTSGISNNEHQVAFSWMEYEKKCVQDMLNIFSKAIKETDPELFIGKTEKQIQQYIKKKLSSKGDWILDAESALQHGLIDGIN